MASELWRDCVDWLTRCQIISTEHRVNKSDADIKLFATMLRDGVILCNLLEFLDPTTFERQDFCRKPQMAHFLCIQNITLFLEACKIKFGIQKMFEIEMLYDLTDFHCVLQSLSKLSNCRKVQSAHNIPGFSVVSVAGEINGSSNPIYDGLAESTYNSTDYNEHDQQELKAKDTYQKVIEVPLQNHTDESPPGKIEKRLYVIKELIHTEKTYLDTLAILKNQFRKPLKQFLMEEEIKTMFPWIKELEKLHRKFYSELMNTQPPSAVQKLSKVFMQFHKKFVIYGDYCSCLPNALEFIKTVRRTNPLAKQSLKECEQQYKEGKFKLDDLLAVPMQRVLKYPLLLKELVSETPPTHEEYNDLERARETIKDLAEYIDKSADDAKKITVIQQAKDMIINLRLLDDGNMSKYGVLLASGNLVIKVAGEQKEKHLYAFLFEKILILTENQGGIRYNFCQTCDLINCTIGEQDQRTSLLSNTQRYTLILTREGQLVFGVFMKTIAEREKWKGLFGVAIEASSPVDGKSTDHTYFLHTFSKPVTCLHCAKLLKGRIHQGYKCTNCDAVSHKGCVSSTGRCKQLQTKKSVMSEQYLSQFNWYVGSMDREYAEERLASREIGTFLVRVRPHGATHACETIYAISLKVNNGAVNHIKIYKKKREDDIVFYLAARYFKTIRDLVMYYERHALSENFSGLNHTLQWPLKEEYVIPTVDFAPSAENQLHLFQGCKVTVIGRDFDSSGWWYGKTRVNNKIGFFPKNCVRPAHPDEI